MEITAHHQQQKPKKIREHNHDVSKNHKLNF